MAEIEIKGGEALEAALKHLSAAVTTAASVSVGFMGGATEEDGTLVALVAALNEYGVPSRNQPPRPFFRNAIAKNSPKWPHNLAVALKHTDFNAAAALSLLGVEIKEEIEGSIIELTSPPLAASTIAQKSRGKVKKIAGVLGPAKPLIDTGTMLRSVTFKLNTQDPEGE